ncbi:MAG: hypothetical protein LBM09_02470, partial [Candidatus Nomurabacteria bacterium]|nr:hypothetical protein [Candidatus Nomurabacteria bacterium]
MNVFTGNNYDTNSETQYSPQQSSGFHVALAIGEGVNANLAITNTDSEVEGDAEDCKLTPAYITMAGVIITCKVAVTVNTTNDLGYFVTVASSNTETRLVGTGEASGAYINAVAGSLTAPSALSESNWGYAVPRYQSVTGNGFDTAYTVAEKNTDPNTSANPNYDSAFANAKYAQIPASASPTTIRKTYMQASSDTFYIYFATKIDTGQAIGNYGGDVVISIKNNDNNLANAIARHDITYMHDLSPIVCD